MNVNVAAAAPGANPAALLGAPRAALIAALAGFSAMCVELASVRVLAPHFGDSAFVWTNVIGVMLFALALGALTGGRLADVAVVRRMLRIALLAGATLIAVAAFVARPLAAWLADPALPLDAAFGVLVRGSLAATLVLFGPPVFLLGAVAPLLVKGVWDSGASGVGRAAGSVSAAGTLGSLLGTWLPTHVLVPGLGSRNTLLVAAACLVVAAALVDWPRARRRAAVLVVAGMVLLGAWSLVVGSGPARPANAEETLLAEIESPYQYLQVVECADGGVRRRELRINEGLGSFHSVTVLGEPFTGGRYYDLFTLLPALLPDRALQIVSLGSAGGTFQRLFRELFGARAQVIGVELDPAAVDLGRRFLELAAEDRTVIADARQFLLRAAARFDLVLLDAYRHQIYLPSHLSSVEFFQLVRERLQDNGILALNVGGFTFRSPVVRALGNTVASVFGHAALLRVPGSRNFVLMARQGVRIRREELLQWSRLPPQVQARAAGWTGPELWRELAFDPELPIVTDDRPFLDRLHDRMYAGGGRL